LFYKAQFTPTMPIRINWCVLGSKFVTYTPQLAAFVKKCTATFCLQMH